MVMNNDRLHTFLVFALAALLLGTAVHLVRRHDEQVMNGSFRWGTLIDTLSAQPTETERRVARQFTDTTLPELKRLGLISRYSRSSQETIITVSGRLWKDRSDFFRESFLKQIVVYNRVNGFSPRTRIVDDRNGKLYAAVTPPDRTVFF